MNVLISLLSILAIVNARQIEVYIKTPSGDNAWEDQATYCATSTGAVEKVGDACKVLMDADNQLSSDFDFISASSVKQPTQISVGTDGIVNPVCTGGINDINKRCLVYEVNLTDTNDYSGCSVVASGLGVPTKATIATEATALNGKLCRFMPRNNQYIGNVEYHVKFTKQNPHASEVKFVTVKIDAVFTPSISALYGTDGDTNHLDRVVTKQHDALVWMDGAQRVLNIGTDECTATDGIDNPAIHKSGLDRTGACDDNVSGQNGAGETVDVPCSEEERSDGQGTCHTSGVLSYLVAMNQVGSGAGAVITYPKIDSKDYDNIKAAYGVGIQMRVKGHFFDKRYKVIDQSGVETLEDNIGEFEVSTQGIEIDAKYGRYGGARQPHKTTFNLKKKNYDDYPTGACSKQAINTADPPVLTDDSQLLGACTSEPNGNDYAVYYMDHEHLLVYEHIKHVQPSYLRDATCGGVSCAHALILKGFKDGSDEYQVQVKLPVNVGADTADNVVGNIPKSDWDIYIPKLKVTAKDVAGLVTDSGNKDIRPKYGLPVQDTESDPQHPDGIPLSYLFNVELEEEKEANTYTVDSYDDGYELFTKLSIRTSGGRTMIEEHYLNTSESTILCSSNRVADVKNAYGQGKVYNLGRSTQIVEQAINYFNKCRLKVLAIDTINDNLKFLDQTLISWNSAHDPRCCQADDKVESLIGSKCDAGVAALCQNRDPHNRALSTNALAKLTLIDNRKVMIGTTELSLLRRQEISEDHGVVVSGSNIHIALSKQNGDESSTGVLEFEIWGTQSMAGYTSSATPCKEVGNGCDEIHGCIAGFNGLTSTSADDEDTEKCNEKTVATPEKDNEYTLHTIRSSSQCNGRLDIQLRQKSPAITTQSLLMDGNDDGILRPVYDVRLPCSRVTARTSDDLTIKFDFDAEYDLALDQYTFKVGGNSDMGAAADQNGDNLPGVWTKTYDEATSGFTKTIVATPYVGECGSYFDSTNAITVATETGCGSDFARDACGDFCVSQKTEDAGSCAKLQIGAGADDDKLEKSFYLALVYERTFKYNVPRSHDLDGTIGPTQTTETTWFCQDQQFSVSVERNKQASVRVTTPLQIIVERKAQIQEIEWTSTGCTGTNVFKLRVRVHVQEQNVQGDNILDDFKEIPADDKFKVTPVSSTDGLVAAIVARNAGSSDPSYVDLESACIQISQADCSLAAPSPFKDLTQTSTEFLVTGSDANLGTSATQIAITSNVVVSTNFVACPLGDEIEETGELEARLSFDSTTGGADTCLTAPADRTSTAEDVNGNDIKNCGAALVTSDGYARLHTYVKDSNGLQYEHGANQTTAGNFQIDTATFSLKRYEPGFGVDELGPQVGDSVDLCTMNDVGLATAPTNPAPVVPGSDEALVMKTGDAFACGFNFQQFGVANALNDVFEVSVDVNMKSSAGRRRLLRKTIRLKAGELHSSVGFRVVSDITTVTDEEAASSLPAAQDATNATEVDEEEEEEEDDHTHEDLEDAHSMLVVWVIVGAVVVAVILFILCRNAKAQAGDNVVDLGKRAVGMDGYKKVDTVERFENLRY